MPLAVGHSKNRGQTRVVRVPSFQARCYGAIAGLIIGGTIGSLLFSFFGIAPFFPGDLMYLFAILLAIVSSSSWPLLDRSCDPSGLVAVGDGVEHGQSSQSVGFADVFQNANLFNLDLADVTILEEHLRIASHADARRSPGEDDVTWIERHHL